MKKFWKDMFAIGAFAFIRASQEQTEIEKEAVEEERDELLDRLRQYEDEDYENDEDEFTS